MNHFAVQHVLRLAPGLTYDYTVETRTTGTSTSSVILETSIPTPQTLWPYLTGREEGEGMVVSLTGAPTWDLLALDVHSQGAYGSQDAPYFSGFVMIDRDGDIVWLWNTTTITTDPDLGDAPSRCIDQLDNYSFVMQTMVADEPLIRLSPFGHKLDKLPYDPSCLIVTHESRKTADQQNVLSIKENWNVVPGLDLPQIGDAIVSWSLTDGSLTTLLDLSTFFNPVTDRGYLSDRTSERATCNGSTALVDDWLHTNSVSVSQFDGSLIVSVRHLSTVCSFAQPADDKLQLNWCVSSELPLLSNFTFASEADMFFNQHAVLQLASGNLLMMDNGDARVQGGYAGGGNSSRGIEYSLDFDSWSLSVAWQHPVVYNSHEGSVYPLANGHAIITVPDEQGDRRRRLFGRASSSISSSTSSSSSLPTSRLVEVDGSGNEVASLTVRFYTDTPYRGVPFTSINGETETANSLLR